MRFSERTRMMDFVEFDISYLINKDKKMSNSTKSIILVLSLNLML